MEERFYNLRAGYGTQFYFAEILSRIPKECRWHMRGFEGVISARIIKGGRPGDFLKNDAAILIVSERVLEVLAEHNFERYGTYSIEVSGGKDDLPKYHGLTLLGKGGRVLPKESGFKYGPREPDGTRAVMHMKRLAFDINEWDGTDLFHVEGFSIVTERVKSAFKKAKITNYELTPLEEVSF